MQSTCHLSRFVYQDYFKVWSIIIGLIFQAPVSALTWGHNDKRLFLATGTQIHIAWVSRRIASLQLMCRLRIHNSLQSESQLSLLPLPPRIRSLIGNLFAQTIRVNIYIILLVIRIKAGVVVRRKFSINKV